MWTDPGAGVDPSRYGCGLVIRTLRPMGCFRARPCSWTRGRLGSGWTRVQPPVYAYICAHARTHVNIQFYTDRCTERTAIICTDGSISSAVILICTYHRVYRRTRAHVLVQIHAYTHIYTQEAREMARDVRTPVLWIGPNLPARTCLCMCMYTYAHACTLACTNVYARAYTHVCVQVYNSCTFIHISTMSRMSIHMPIPFHNPQVCTPYTSVHTT